MKKRKLKVLYILLTVTLAFLIALTGMFVPKLLLNTKAKKLATATGRMDNGDVSPYTYTMDTKTRIARVEKLVEQIFISGADMYINVRDPLDTELSCEPAQRTIKKFLIAYADMLEEYGLLSTVERNDTDAPVFGSGNDGNLQYQDRLTESGDAQLERDCTYIQIEPPDFMVSPEDQQLSVWVDSGYIYDQFVEITIDAVTGLPVTVQFGIAGIEPDETWCEATAAVLEKVYGIDLKFGVPEMLYEPYAGDMMRQAGKMDFEYAYGFSCVTQDNALHMEYQYYSEDTGYAKSKTSRDVYGEIYICFYGE